MKVLLVGHAGCYNRGCEAIVRSTLLMLNKEFERPEVVLASYDYDADVKLDYGFPVKVIKGKSTDLWKKGTCDWFKAKLLRRLPGSSENVLIYSPILHELKKADIVISIGGDNYTEDYKFGSLNMYLILNQVIKRYKKKLVIWGASIGPFTHTEKLPEIVAGLNLADLITVREAKSFEYLKSIGVKSIKLVADPAFLLPVSPVDLPDIIKNRNIPLLGFNISPLLKSYMDTNCDDLFLKESVKFLRSMIYTHGFCVILIPHVVQVGGEQTDDYSYMLNIYQELKDSGKIELMSPKYNSVELKYLISKCDVYVGARTHSTIAALSMGIPTLSIGYSQKSVGINEDLLGTLKYLLDIKLYNATNLESKILDLWKDRDLLKKKLNSVLPDIKKMSWKNIEYLKELLSQ